jgi:deaminated glutathione amidase
VKPMLAVVQMTATEDISYNFDVCQSLIQKAARFSAKLVCLPENFAFIGENSNRNKEIAEPLQGELLKSYCLLAKKNQVWLSLGGFLEKSVSQQIFNTHVIVDNTGEIKATYRKVHLFSIDISNNALLDESKTITSGEELVAVQSPVGLLGLSICYDLRFSALYRTLANIGSQIMLVPAAFTSTTGKAHWETLLRARAIESQSYVAAAAQTGIHNAKRASHGHAMIVDPWGTIVGQCSEGASIALAPIDLDYLAAVRRRIPVLKHQRVDVYQKPVTVYE